MRRHNTTEDAHDNGEGTGGAGGINTQHTLRLQRARPLAVEFLKPALFINTSRLGVRVKHLQEEGKSRNALAGTHSLCAKLLCLKTSEGASERRSFLDLELGNLQVLVEGNADILCKCIA